MTRSRRRRCTPSRRAAGAGGARDPRAPQGVRAPLGRVRSSTGGSCQCTRRCRRSSGGGNVECRPRSTGSSTNRSARSRLDAASARSRPSSKRRAHAALEAQRGELEHQLVIATANARPHSLWVDPFAARLRRPIPECRSRRSRPGNVRSLGTRQRTTASPLLLVRLHSTSYFTSSGTNPPVSSLRSALATAPTASMRSAPTT